MLLSGDVLEGPVVVRPESGLGVEGVAVGVGGEHAGGDNHPDGVGVGAGWACVSRSRKIRYLAAVDRKSVV